MTRELPKAVDRTEVYPNLYVGGKVAEWHFPGRVFDLREPDEDPPVFNYRRPVFQRLANGGWRADPVVAQQVVEEIAGELDQGKKVLVRCGSGVERSPAIAALYLIRKQGMTPTEAYARIRAARPQVIEELDLLPLTYEERTQ
jgi:protein-tyrosine phosphatase